MKTNLNRAAMALLLLFTLFSIHSCNEESIESKNSISNDLSELDKNFAQYEIVKIDFDPIWNLAKSQPQNEVEINLGLENHSDWTFRLSSDNLNDMMDEDFKMYQVGENNQLIETPKFEIYALSGSLNKSEKTSNFIMSLGQLEAQIVDGTEEYYLEPLSNFNETAPQDEYVLYNAKDILTNDKIAEINKEVEVHKENQTNYEPGAKVATRFWGVEISLIGDYQLYRKFNNTNKTYKWMYNRFYFSNENYKNNNIEVKLLLKRMYLYDTYSNRNFPANDTSEYRNFIAQYRNNTSANWYQPGDLNYYFTGKNVRGVLGGHIALETICVNERSCYAFGEYLRSGLRSNTMMSHETAHMMGAVDDQSGTNIMNPNIAGSTYFTRDSKIYVNATVWRQSSCLTRLF